MADHVSIEQANFSGKRVLVRVDFNVPLDDGHIRDDTRIRASLPTIRKLVGDGARVVLCSHLGRPKGKPNAQLSLQPVAHVLGKLLGTPVGFVEDCVGAEVEEAVKALQPGGVLLLENVRFHAEEEANDADFARALAGIADAYVNDAFGSAHRAHASTEGVARLLPAYAGLLMVKEIETLGALLAGPEKPFVAVLGGAKVSGKIDVIQNLLPRVDALIIGGAMAFTFSRALGGAVGDSLVEEDKVDVARHILDDARTQGVDVLLPVDVVVSKELKGNGGHRVVPFGEVPDGFKGVDIGPASIKAFSERIVQARTVFVNGPMGVFEVPAFRNGTAGVLKAVAECDGFTVAGGGDTAAALADAGVTEDVGHVSTGGGASLEFVEGKTLPGVAALRKASAVAR